MQDHDNPSDPHFVGSGCRPLDLLIDGFRLGDNVVWQVDDLADYQLFARDFCRQVRADQRPLVYVRFAPHAPVVPSGPGLMVETVDPRSGFDVFSAQVNRLVTRYGEGACYVFDSLSSLVDLWATDELLANFFQATCPYLFELDTVAFFALERGRHADGAVARIRDTTQVLLDAFRWQDDLYVRPLKVWQRHSPRMFLPHRVSGDHWIPVAPATVPATTLARETQAPWDTVYAELKALHGGAAESDKQHATHLTGLLARMLLGDDPFVLDTAGRYLPSDVLMRVRERVVGSGRIGGKAAGMLLARAIVRQDLAEGPATCPLLEEDSFYIGSDVFYTFLVLNDLFRTRLELTGAGRIEHEAFEDLEQRFLAGQFHADHAAAFERLLEQIGEEPIIVRSSSLLEDGFGNAFAGKYISEFCVNCGTLPERMTHFMAAVKRVYASTLNPDALSYRRNRGLLQSDEQMAILVQRVAGAPHGRYFFPVLAGVAFSRNLYAWTDRIDPRAGMIRLVFGLGTRAVNRVSRDYPRLIAVSEPTLRPEIGKEIRTYSQREVDVLDLEAGGQVTVSLLAVLREAKLPDLHYLVSMQEDGYTMDPVSRVISAPENAVLTFNRLIKETRFVDVMSSMLTLLEERYGQPVDTEFTAELQPGGRVEINLLQCRPMWLPGTTQRVSVPEDIPAGRVLFGGDRFMNGGVVDRIRYVLYVDPRRYGALEDEEVRRVLPRVIGRINRDLSLNGGKLVLMGPGRWGSRNPDLGIGVGYADIDRVSVLVEMAFAAGGEMPEVSYGTHFFQDLVEAGIIYMPLYPSQPGCRFNDDFFANAPNALCAWFPDLAAYAGVVRLVALPGDGARLVADPESRRALCYLA